MPDSPLRFIQESPMAITSLPSPLPRSPVVTGSCVEPSAVPPSGVSPSVSVSPSSPQAMIVRERARIEARRERSRFMVRISKLYGEADESLTAHALVLHHFPDAGAYRVISCVIRMNSIAAILE